MIIILKEVLSVRIYKMNFRVMGLEIKILKSREGNQRKPHKQIVILKKPILKVKKNNKKLKIVLKNSKINRPQIQSILNVAIIDTI